MVHAHCVKCGAQTGDGVQFCPSCGAALSDSTDTVESGAVSVPPAAPVGSASLDASQQASDADAAVTRYPNAVLGWFVVGFLVFPLFSLFTYGGGGATPTVVAVVLGAGLIVTRIRRNRFSRGWFTATAIVGGVLTLGGCGLVVVDAAETVNGGYATGNGGAYSAFFVSALLAVIAAIRSK